MAHPSDELIDLGFNKRGHGEYDGYFSGVKVIIQIDEIHQFTDEEPVWEAEVFIENDFGQVESRQVVGEASSERGAIKKAIKWVKDWRRKGF